MYFPLKLWLTLLKTNVAGVVIVTPVKMLLRILGFISSYIVASCPFDEVMLLSKYQARVHASATSTPNCHCNVTVDPVVKYNVFPPGGGITFPTQEKILHFLKVENDLFWTSHNCYNRLLSGFAVECFFNKTYLHMEAPHN